MEYLNVISEHLGIYDFLKSRSIVSITRLPSVWRRENLILKIDCKKGSYVYKRLKEERGEIQRMQILKRRYPHLITNLHKFDDTAYLMDFIEGKNFFGLNNEERVDKVSLCAKALEEIIIDRSLEKADIKEKVSASFGKYRRKAAMYFNDSELPCPDLFPFSASPIITSHNDLNAANVIYDGNLKFIDPSEEGYDDIARDIGRYCASTFFNNYDYGGNDKKHSLDIAIAFLSGFDDETLERARYFIGESFLSFINFQTHSTPKSVLKKLAMSVLTSTKPLKTCLEESL